MRFTRVLPLPLAAVATAVTALALSTVAQAAPEKIDLDPAHTHVGFSIRHIFTPVRGEFQKVKGTIELDRDNTEAAKETLIRGTGEGSNYPTIDPDDITQTLEEKLDTLGTP